MRTFTSIFTINGSFGDYQGRLTVKAAGRCARAAMHLLAWHAASLGKRLHGLKSLVVGSVTEAVYQGMPSGLPLMRPPIGRLCRQPVRQSFGRHGSRPC